MTLGQVESLRDPVAGELTRAGDVATGPRQQAVAQAWFSYLEEVVRMLSTPDASTFRLRELAVGGGVDGPQAYAERVVEGGLRLSGGMVATLQEVTVDGDRATVRGCVHSSMVEVDSVGEPVGELVPWLRASNSLVRAGDSWLVDHHRLERSEKCV